jgi:hypothetical protein
MDLRPGDIQLLNNSVVLHSRTAYHDEEHRKRYLLRLWLNVENLISWAAASPFSGSISTSSGCHYDRSR